MKLVIYPDVNDGRLKKIRAAAGVMRVVNRGDVADAEREMPDADAFFGKMTPGLLIAANQLRWVQSPTASLEHYIFPALADHPCTLSNMRGLFSDAIADQVFGRRRNRSAISPRWSQDVDSMVDAQPCRASRSRYLIRSVRQISCKLLRQLICKVTGGAPDETLWGKGCTRNRPVRNYVILGTLFQRAI